MKPLSQVFCRHSFQTSIFINPPDLGKSYQNRPVSSTNSWRHEPFFRKGGMNLTRQLSTGDADGVYCLCPVWLCEYGVACDERICSKTGYNQRRIGVSAERLSPLFNSTDYWLLTIGYFPPFYPYRTKRASRSAAKIRRR